MIRRTISNTGISQAINSLPRTVHWRPEPSQFPSSQPKPTTTRPFRKIEDFALPHQKTKGTGIKSFVFRYSRNHAYSITCHWREWGIPNGQDRFSRRWNERTDTLWWTATAFKSFAAKRVVRSHATRKIRLAFTESLRKKGIAPDGSRLGQSNEAPVIGTAAFHPETKIMSTSMEDLVLEMDQAVDRILQLQHNKQEKGVRSLVKKASKPRAH
jgi:hypothetical protein